jgi:hypothetical protein
MSLKSLIPFKPKTTALAASSAATSPFKEIHREMDCRDTVVLPVPGSP